MIWKKIWRSLILWYLGGMLYTGIELLWRGWSHGSMFIAGGVCLLLIGALGMWESPLPIVWRMPLGAAIITAVELSAGLIVNRSHTVWDYSALPFNFHGQICLPFSLLWIPVSLAAIAAFDIARRLLFHEPFPHYNWL